MSRQLLLFDVNRTRRPRQFRRLADPFDIFNDEEIRQRYRFTKASIGYITDLIQDDIGYETRRNYALCPRLRLMLALRFYASGSIQRVCGDTIGANQTTVCRCIRDVTNALIKHIDNYIHMPTGNELMAVQTAFQQVARIPGIIGCIDGTQIPIVAPAANEYEYVNRKGRHAINVQAICDFDGKFINIDANWPGSVHDSRIFTESAVGRKFVDGRVKGILLGDSGYALKPYLLTPFANPTGRAQIRYNKVHSVTRSRVERLFGRWKRRFMCLHLGLRCRNPQMSCKVIGACAILQNIAFMMKESEDFDDQVNEEDEDPTAVPSHQLDGKVFRDRIVAEYFS